MPTSPPAGKARAAVSEVQAVVLLIHGCVEEAHGEVVHIERYAYILPAEHLLPLLSRLVRGVYASQNYGAARAAPSYSIIKSMAVSIFYVHYNCLRRICKVTYAEDELLEFTLLRIRILAFYLLIIVIRRPLAHHLRDEAVCPRRLYAEAARLASPADKFLETFHIVKIYTAKVAQKTVLTL